MMCATTITKTPFFDGIHNQHVATVKEDDD